MIPLPRANVTAIWSWTVPGCSMGTMSAGATGWQGWIRGRLTSPSWRSLVERYWTLMISWRDETWMRSIPIFGNSTYTRDLLKSRPEEVSTSAHRTSESVPTVRVVGGMDRLGQTALRRTRCILVQMWVPWKARKVRSLINLVWRAWLQPTQVRFLTSWQTIWTPIHG